MKSKNTTIIMMLVTMFVLVGNPGQLKAQESDEKQSAKIKTGITEDQYVEYFAQTMYITQKMLKDIEELPKKMGVTQKEIDAYVEKSMENYMHYAKLVERATLRVEELQGNDE